MIRILFVCMGNICRSPMAQGVFVRRARERGAVERFAVDSAGTGDWHVGSPPDPRAQAAARARKIELSHLRARQVTSDDFYDFDWVIAMDRSNLRHLQPLARGRAQLHLLREFDAAADSLEVPDPYYGGEQGFEDALDMIETACDGLISHCLGGHNEAGSGG